jgi:hypothetical protein
MLKLNDKEIVSMEDFNEKEDDVIEYGAKILE